MMISCDILFNGFFIDIQKQNKKACTSYFDFPDMKTKRDTGYLS